MLSVCLALSLLQDPPVTRVPANKDTVKIVLSGESTMDYVNRSREITAFIDSISNPFGLGSPLTSRPENTVEGYVAMRFDAELNSKIAFVLEIGTKRVEGDPDPLINNGKGILRLGENEEAPVPAIREAHVTITDLLAAGLAIELGLTTWTFDVRGRGSSFAFAPRRSVTWTRNVDSASAINGFEQADERLIDAGFPDEVEPFGAWVAFNPGGFIVDIVLLPAVVEGGQPNRDEALYVIDGWLPIDSVGKGSRIGAIIGLTSFSTNVVTPGGEEHAKTWTIGLGADLHLMDGALDVFIEGYFQTGRVGEVGGQDVDAAGRAFQLGFEWRHTAGNPMPIWVNATYFYISGDGDTDPADDQANRFASYENVNDLIVLEDAYLGLNWSSNFTGLKFGGGIAVSAIGKDDLSIEILIGITRTAEDVGAAPNETDKLGNEIDLKLKWSLNKQFMLRLSLGFLVGSDVLENAMDGGVPGSNPQAEDSASLWLFGFDIKV